jgi:cell division protein ZapA (FtsZ GTPase activity inhibitor)
VLVALNIADEFFRERERETQSSSDELQERAIRLERIVDEALAQVSVKQAV